MATEPQSQKLVGTTVANKFRIERLLGAGAMGEVYVAEQLSLGKRVAIKVLHRHLAGEPGIAKRFHREARAASILEHPNCIHIIDFGEDDGLLYIAMELLSGRDLLKVIKSEAPLPVGRIVHLMAQVLGALDEAHAKGVVHRDLKPENVMVSDLRGKHDFVKVCDFGIAKLTSERESTSAITMAGMVCGTPEYMSPEQARGDELDGRTDLYAAACILYQLVVGDVPFRAGSALGVVTKQLMEQPQAPSQRATVDPAMESLILRGLEKDRAKRWQTAAEMKAALEAVATPTPGDQRAPTIPPATAAALGVAKTEQQFATPTPQPASTTPSMATGQVAEAPKPRSRTLLFAASAVLVLGAGAAIAIATRRPNPPAPPPIATPSPPIVAAAPPPVPAPTPAPVAAPTPPPIAVPAPPEAPAKAPDPVAKIGHHRSAKSRGSAPAPEPAPAPTPTPAPPLAPPPARSSAQAAPHTYAALFAEAQSLFTSGDTEKAAAKYEEAARLSPDSAVVHRELGKCYSRLGHRDRAQKEYHRYLELAPNASDARFYRSIVGQTTPDPPK